MKKQTIIYCYRMTHDYGINPCVFTENYEETPELLTEGGCMVQLRRNLRKNWADKIRNKEVDAYIMAVAGRSDDGGKSRDEQGAFITPKYNHLVFVAKISEITSWGEYLSSPISEKRRDAYTYNYYLDKDSWESKLVHEPIILAERFAYFGKSPLALPKAILDFFPMGERARLTGKPFPRWNTKNGFYNSNERLEDTKELLAFIESLLADGNVIADLPYHPFYLKGDNK